jgi:hypothetical protein
MCLNCFDDCFRGPPAFHHHHQSLTHAVITSRIHLSTVSCHRCSMSAIIYHYRGVQSFHTINCEHDRLSGFGPSACALSLDCRRCSVVHTANCLSFKPNTYLQLQLAYLFARHVEHYRDVILYSIVATKIRRSSGDFDLQELSLSIRFLNLHSLSDLRLNGDSVSRHTAQYCML